MAEKSSTASRHLRAGMVTLLAGIVVTALIYPIWRLAQTDPGRQMRILGDLPFGVFLTHDQKRSFTPADWQARLVLALHLPKACDEAKCLAAAADFEGMRRWYMSELAIDNYPETAPENALFVVLSEIPFGNLNSGILQVKWNPNMPAFAPVQDTPTVHPFLVISVPHVGFVWFQDLYDDPMDLERFKRIVRKLNVEFQLNFYLRNESNFNVR